jgi:translation initiation factor IF-3
LIDAEGNQRGILPTREALSIAKDAALDLVVVSPNVEPPVCKVMDFGKHRFDLSKKHAASKKKQKKVHLKEIKFRPGTDEGDFNVKLKKILKFLENGDKVKITIRFRGREMMHQELGVEMMRRVEEAVGETATVEQNTKLEGRQIFMMLAPKKKV